MRDFTLVIADLAAWEGVNNPVEDPDSNPVGLLVDGNRFVVADAGGNYRFLIVRLLGDVLFSAGFED